jgi:hypothetical protein
MVFVNGMLAEVFDFVLKGLLNRHLVEDGLLGAALDTVVAEFERVDCSLQQVKSISALVHQIYLRQYAYCAFALRIYLSGKLERV